MHTESTGCRWPRVTHQDPTSIGNALLNLATQILRSKLPADKAELPTNILNTEVQLAVTALKAYERKDA